MDIKEAQGQFESGRTVVMGTPSRCAETGEAYVCICSGGSKEEGEPAPGVYNTQGLAVAEWLRAVRDYAVGKRGALYWRDVPELHSCPCGPDDVRWVVYSRLLISDKPCLTKAEANEVFGIDSFIANDLKARGLLA